MLTTTPHQHRLVGQQITLDFHLGIFKIGNPCPAVTVSCVCVSVWLENVQAGFLLLPEAELLASKTSAP